jgi:hypothetical protein
MSDPASASDKPSLRDRIAFHISWICGAVLVFGCGMAAANYKLIPSDFFKIAESGYEKINEMKDPVQRYPYSYNVPRDRNRPRIFNKLAKSDDLNFITRVGPDGELWVDIMDMAGNVVHKWSIDWFTMWPNATHIPEKRKPKSRPGTEVHGAALLDNGNMVFNFDGLGLVCLNMKGDVVWRLPYFTHHSVVKSDDGNIWVCGCIDRDEANPRLPNWKPSFCEDTALVVSPDGKILHEWSIIDLLLKNGKEGLLYLRSPADKNTITTGDILHLNDVEPFPLHMKEGFFKHGDVMVSLRNINTVFVFNQSDGKIKFLSIGQVVRQHDPDFVDGNTISVFDNNNTNVDTSDVSKNKSKIVKISAPDQTLTTYYEGTKEQPFYTNVMGKHQWLANGNLLISEPCNGRAFEINPKKEIVWEYNNITAPGYVGFMEEVTRLDPSQAKMFQAAKKTSQKP